MLVWYIVAGVYALGLVATLCCFLVIDYIDQAKHGFFRPVEWGMALLLATIWPLLLLGSIGVLALRECLNWVTTEFRIVRERRPPYTDRPVVVWRGTSRFTRFRKPTPRVDEIVGRDAARLASPTTYQLEMWSRLTSVWIPANRTWTI